MLPGQNLFISQRPIAYLSRVNFPFNVSSPEGKPYEVTGESKGANVSTETGDIQTEVLVYVTYSCFLGKHELENSLALYNDSI